MSDVQVTDNTARHRFEVSLDGDTAFAEYRLKPGQLEMPHTLVPPAFEGKGIAGALARHAFGYARDHGLKVVPTCPFMASWAAKHPEVQDLVDPAWTAEQRTA